LVDEVMLAFMQAFHRNAGTKAGMAALKVCSTVDGSAVR
jgi:hypothetical protein